MIRMNGIKTLDEPRSGYRAHADVEDLAGGAEIGLDRIEAKLTFRQHLSRRLGEEIVDKRV
ncbi:hypothetical protein CODIS_40890 [Candidatus Thiodiazotropha endolucinida]|uniref:Uncharacterized protein n=1 Tax=Candidatus Thiodiazotropha endolucinida TaxID=1655433 RepID=A0A7Z0VHJ7_9GAMM|nr:hypothetical protein CODIS_40890 [Candidatus Thiodiazotropha endolucinida]